MAGEAKTNAFMLASATVMIGPQADLRKLNPAAHSIGLVKNFTISATPAYTDLMQGVKQELVYSLMTANPVQATMEAFEFTGKNLSYALGLDGSALAPITVTDVTNTQIVGDGTIAAVVLTALTDTSAGYPVGANVYIQELGGSDIVHLSKVTATVYSSISHTTTLTLATPIPVGVTFDIGSKVSVVNRINVGSTASQPFFSAKVVGILPEQNQPIIIELPKIRIIKGFSLAFTSGAFGNMPLEFKPHDLVPSDTFYAEFVGKGPVAVYTGQ
jgi:hypothetical protein